MIINREFLISASNDEPKREGSDDWTASQEQRDNLPIQQNTRIS